MGQNLNSTKMGVKKRIGVKKIKPAEHTYTGPGHIGSTSPGINKMYKYIDISIDKMTP